MRRSGGVLAMAHSFGNDLPGPPYDPGVKREFSAGGVVVRRIKGAWHVAAIHPRGRRPGLWALPKGNIDPGETPAETAVREVYEETGVVGKLDEKLGDVKYTYTWDGERIFKIVSFFLVRYSSGRLGEIAPGDGGRGRRGPLAPDRRGAEAPRLRRRAADGRARDRSSRSVSN